MPRRFPFPSYPCKPHRSGQARIRVAGQDVYLGPHGSEESWGKFRRLKAAWIAGGPAALAAEEAGAGAGTGSPLAPALLVRDVAARYLAAMELERTNADGSRPWSELVNYRHAFRPLLALYGDTPAAAFGPRALKVVQGAMATGAWVGDEDVEVRKKGWCRRVVNRNTVRLQTVWKWAESEELVPKGSYAGLHTVKGLRKHQHGVREKPKIRAVTAEHVAAILPHLNPVARAAVQLLQLSGARPGELCKWTPADVVMGKVEVGPGSYADIGDCWCVWRREHKTADDDDAGRFVLLGPQAQAILRPFLDRPRDCPLFSPAEGRRLQLAEMRAKRKTKVQPSQTCRAKASPAKQPRQQYDPDSLTGAIQYACRRAKVASFTAYQLRHSAGTAIGAAGDAESARIALGHADLNTTRIYMQDDLAKAARVVAKVG